MNKQEQAAFLIEAMPYIKKYFNKILVVKYGGNAMIDDELKSSVMRDLVVLNALGIKVVLVHGGGPEINKALALEGIEPKFFNGLRVTDEKTMQVVESVLSGKINKSIVAEFQRHKTKAVGISGKDGMLIEAEKKMPDGADIGFVGDIKKINTDYIITTRVSQNEIVNKHLKNKPFKVKFSTSNVKTPIKNCEDDTAK